MRKATGLLLVLLFAITLVAPVQAAATFSSNATGTQDGYDYELWKDSGTTSMTLNGGGAFSCNWSNINNALFRMGKKFDQTKTHTQIGTISVEYAATFNPGGNSYLCVYGWSIDPLVEYYIVDAWGEWRPPGATSKGTVTIDGGTYDIYETTRTEQPSIQGNKTFKQYWSVRTSTRTSGTISVSEHFKAWENKGMTLGKLYETAFTVEGYKSNGSANVTKNILKINGKDIGTGNSGGGDTGGGTTATKVECESMTLGGQYAGKISSPFSGIALYANNDLCKYTQYFSSGTHTFSLRGASNNSKTATVELRIGGQKKGTFTFSGTTPSVSTISNVSHGTGNQEIQLIVTSDDGSWDVFLDYLEIK